MSIHQTQVEFHDTLAAPAETQEENRDRFPRLARLGGPEEISQSSPGVLRVPFLALPAPILAHYDGVLAAMVLPVGVAPAVLHKKGKVAGYYKDMFCIFIQHLVDTWYADGSGWHCVSETL